jgi:hypothetical protein
MPAALLRRLAISTEVDRVAHFVAVISHNCAHDSAPLQEVPSGDGLKTIHRSTVRPAARPDADTATDR